MHPKPYDQIEEDWKDCPYHASIPHSSLHRSEATKQALRARTDDEAIKVIMENWGFCATSNTMRTFLQHSSIRREAWASLDHHQLAKALVRWSRLVNIFHPQQVLDSESVQAIKNYTKSITKQLNGQRGVGPSTKKTAYGYISLLCKSALIRAAKDFQKRNKRAWTRKERIVRTR